MMMTLNDAEQIDPFAVSQSSSIHVESVIRDLQKLVAKHVVDTRRLDALRELCGFVEDGSDTVVTLCQDDATRSWHVKARDDTRFTYGASFREAIDAATSK